jgi:hypothetical protein
LNLPVVIIQLVEFKSFNSVILDFASGRKFRSDRPKRRAQDDVLRDEVLNLVPFDSDPIDSRHSHTLQDWQIIISGPFEMVYRTCDELVEHGVNRSNLYLTHLNLNQK